MDEAPLAKLLAMRALDRVASQVPQSFEAEEPCTASTQWEMIEYLSYTIAGVEDLDWLYEMRKLGKQLSNFDPVSE